MTLAGLLLFAAVLSNSVAQTVAWNTVSQGGMSNIDEPRQAVVRTAADWQTLWKQHDPGRAAPPVDFNQSMVAAVFLGSRPTAGFMAEITAVKTEGDRTVVEYRERQPAADAFVAQVLTSPFHAVRFPRTAGSVEFSRVKP